MSGEVEVDGRGPILRITARTVEIGGGLFQLAGIAGIQVTVRSRAFRLRPPRLAVLASWASVALGVVALCNGIQSSSVVVGVATAIVVVNLIGYGLRLLRVSRSKVYLLRIDTGGRAMIVYAAPDRDEVGRMANIIAAAIESPPREDISLAINPRGLYEADRISNEIR
jgi:hypothetical protein